MHVYDVWTPELGTFLVDGLDHDEHGFYWEKQFPEDQRAQPYWSATKPYQNAQLLWWDDTRNYDGTLKRLDDALSEIARS